MDNTDTISIVNTQEWPTVRMVTITPNHPIQRETVTLGLFDCRACFEATGQAVNHMDDSPCVTRPDLPGGF